MSMLMLMLIRRIIRVIIIVIVIHDSNQNVKFDLRIFMILVIDVLLLPFVILILR